MLGRCRGWGGVQTRGDGGDCTGVLVAVAGKERMSHLGGTLGRDGMGLPCVCVSVHAHTHVCIHAYASICVRVYIHMYVSPHVCLHLCLCPRGVSTAMCTHASGGDRH